MGNSKSRDAEQVRQKHVDEIVVSSINFRNNYKVDFKKLFVNYHIGRWEVTMFMFADTFCRVSPLCIYVFKTLSYGRTTALLVIRG